MKVASNAEVLKWMAEIEWNHGIKTGGTTPYYARIGCELHRVKVSGNTSQNNLFRKSCANVGN